MGFMQKSKSLPLVCTSNEGHLPWVQIRLLPPLLQASRLLKWCKAEDAKCLEAGPRCRMALVHLLPPRCCLGGFQTGPSLLHRRAQPCPQLLLMFSPASGMTWGSGSSSEASCTAGSFLAHLPWGGGPALAAHMEISLPVQNPRPPKLSVF